MITGQSNLEMTSLTENRVTSVNRRRAIAIASALFIAGATLMAVGLKNLTFPNYPRLAGAAFFPALLGFAAGLVLIKQPGAWPAAIAFSAMVIAIEIERFWKARSVGMVFLGLLIAPASAGYLLACLCVRQGRAAANPHADGQPDEDASA